ncbi:phospho-sugar mutase [Kocuria rosea]|uniref:phospho-sugar mutase n=1 Tax=Kocuria rosea TaxID=1275 RepID=UPI000D64D134|nr:phospho-sugar mutase [Kocuria rosea]PWF88783.1 phosphomannomutase [Kocuria rosea]STX15516.1 Probable phosphomannomutase [Kocuria rosea]
MTTDPRTDPQLLDAARAWGAADPDPATRAELAALVEAAAAGDAAARAELADRFSGTLQFGTAGLRAALGAGPMRMNRVVVLRAAAGLAAHVLAVHTPADGAAGSARRPRAVVGYDARHGSEVFARDTAAVFTAAGIETLLLPAPLPTPVLAWAVRALEAEVGVMVTASHNPPADNGYKVYLGGRAVEPEARGCQIVAPHDRMIAERIAAVGPVEDIPRAQDGWTVLPSSVEQDYLDAVLPAVVPAAADGERPLRVVLTPLHGVGGRTTTEALRRAGLADVHVVPEQAEPDPDFPTVAFPNPEEPGALDLALATARAVGADLVLANDPDADRVAVAVPVPGVGAGGAGQEWRMLRGDEVGALLGHAAAARSAGRTGAVFANSIVSSRLLGRIAAAAGIAHQETLTGFKWIARVPGLAYGYEEALGYCVAPEVVRDKDGISAAVAVAVLADELHAQGRTLLDVLDDLALAHGLYATDQLSVRVADLGRIPVMAAALRDAPPADLGGSAVVEVADLAAPGTGLPPTEGLRLLTADGTRVIVRPSGTEPKLKCYLEVVAPVAGRAALPVARDEAQERLGRIRAELEAALGL